MSYEQGLIFVGNRVYEFERNAIKINFEEYGKFNGKFYRRVTSSNTLCILTKKIETKNYFELFIRCVKYPYGDIDGDIYGDLYYNPSKGVFVFTSGGEYEFFAEEDVLDLFEKGKL